MNKSNSDISFYVLSFMSKTEGVLASGYDLERTKTEIEKDMKKQLGEDGYHILELRPISREEVERMGYDSEALAASVPEETADPELPGEDEIAPDYKNKTLH